MNLLDNPEVKNRYKKYKFRLKKWENDFMEKYGKRPNKDDIHKADPSVRDAYKKYWTLKTQALDETLLDITFEDESQANVSANSSSVDQSSSVSQIFSKAEESKLDNPGDSVSTSLNASPEIPCKNAENIAPDKTSTTSSVQEFSAVIGPKDDSTNIEGAWGDHLNKDKEPPKTKKSLLIGRSCSFQLSQKKFNSGTFSKRNPRKSLSMNRIKSKTDLDSSSTMGQATSTEKSDEDVCPKSMFGTNIRIVENDTKVPCQSVNTVFQLLDNEKPLTSDRKLNAGWLDRCSKENNLMPINPNLQRLSGDSGVYSTDSSVSPVEVNRTASPIAQNSNSPISDDEDFVCNSDSENEHRNKRFRNWRKTFSEEIVQQPKRICVEDATRNIPSSNFISSQAPILSQQTSANIDQVKKTNQDEILRNIEGKPTTTEVKTVEKMKCDEYEFIESEESDEKTRTKKSSRSTRQAKNETVRKKRIIERKTRATTRKVVSKKVTRSRRGKIESESEDDEGGDKGVEEFETNSDKSQTPIYGVESFDVVPRFAVPRNSNGDLVSELCKTVAQTESLDSTKIDGKKLKSAMSDREKLEAKIAAGKLNENFVRIDIKKKVFVRGKSKFNFSRYKKNQWKQKKKDLASSEGSLDLADLAEKNTCFRCGGSGHISRKCPAMKSDELLPPSADDQSDFPTLEEAEKMASQGATMAHSNRPETLPQCPSFVNDKAGNSSRSDSPIPEENEDFEFNDDDFGDEMDGENNATQTPIVGFKIPEDLVAKLLPPVNGAIDPVYPLGPNKQIIESPAEVLQTLKMFGHQSFRPGQEKAVMRILSGRSTLVTLSTGSGKSLCYQLPAYLYAKKSRCITLVVSPLVSLMDDQVTGVPHFLSAAALHTGQTPKVREKIMQAVRDGELNILLVSPEAIVAGEKSTGFGALLRQLPPIAFACIDEAHCISQWSHNFRPSYLMICRVLIEKLGVKTILGLTATATKSTSESILEHLKIPDGMSGVIADIPMPNNLTLSVSKDEQKDRALVDLLKSERFEECDSIIVYCTRREECTRIAGLIRISLQNTVNPDKPKPKAKVSQICEAYHAGLGSSRRKVIQRAFMKGDIRIVVATVAFGMGINKSNIRSVIHYNMPSSFEGYVQEVGRAGRDNLPAHCHLFLSPQEDQDKWELRRHIYADGVDRHSIRRLLQKIFIPCSCAKNSNGSKRCPGHEVAIPIDETVRALDISEQTISTLLCYLELHPKKFITVLSSVYVNAKVSSYAGPQALKAAAQSSPPLAMAIAMDTKKGISHDNDCVIEFPVVDVAAAIGWDSGVVKSHLKNLEWTTIGGKSKRSAISVKYDTLGLRVRAPGDLTESELDEALEALYERSQSQEKSALQQLEAIHAALNKFSYNFARDCIQLNDESLQKSENLKGIIREYFKSDSPLSCIDFAADKKHIPNESQIISDVRSLICSYRDNNFSGRAVARIFHGIQSPNYPALVWYRCRFWRAHVPTDFNYICQVATKEILSMR